jgi:3-oxocholest-4-en-26-oate---CoA ligase
VTQVASPRTVRLRLGSSADDESSDTVTAYESALARSTSDGLDGVRKNDDLYLLMTGGTTGAPKAVLWRQEDLLVAALGGWDAREQRPLRSVDDWMARLAQRPRVTVAALPFMHGAAQWCALSSLFTGGTVAIQDRVDRFDAADILDTVSRSRAAVLMIAGDAFAKPLIRELNATPRDMTSLRFVLFWRRVIDSEREIGLRKAIASRHRGGECGSVGVGVAARHPHR